jgi:hypothetical protein
MPARRKPAHSRKTATHKTASKTAAKTTAEGVAKALVATRDPGERRARSQARCLHAAGSKADRSIAQALGGTQLAPQDRRLSLGAVDADVLYQPRRQDLAQDAARAAAARQDRVEAAVWKRVIPSSRRTHLLWNTESPGHRRAEATPSFGRLCREMTAGMQFQTATDTASRSRRAFRASFAFTSPPLPSEGAGNAGRSMRPQPRV